MAGGGCGWRNPKSEKTVSLFGCMKVVIDSSVFVAAFREKEPYSREAFSIVERLQEGSLSAYLPVSVVIEVVAAIRRRSGSVELAEQVGQAILTLPDISLIDLTTFRMARYLELAQEIGLAGMDVIVVGTAQEFDVPLLTLDKEIIERVKKSVHILNMDDFKER